MDLASNALVDLASVKEYLNISDTTKDNFLIRKINAASTLVEQYINRSLKVNSYTENLQGNNRQYLTLMNYPLVSVESVSFFDNILDPSQYNVDDYCMKRGMIYKETGWTSNDFLIGIGGDPVPGKKIIQVQYHAGYATIPEDIQDAVIDLVALKFKESIYGDNRFGIESESVGAVKYTYSKKDLAIPASISSVLDRYVAKRV
ncbi:phage gp6-like head-tail connector protein [Clostridium felsineum]|uniref:head-tail connector protein n=1 Tax=Clostridium felsineum TaxID=36839 RepID=UPI00214D690D|nr:head-tail connector protein [Clostridium felsineum]MCR3759154.1 phage gp6-like head-tail connector protein [Clostridium felsineum]